MSGNETKNVLHILTYLLPSPSLWLGHAVSHSLRTCSIAFCSKTSAENRPVCNANLQVYNIQSNMCGHKYERGHSAGGTVYV